MPNNSSYVSTSLTHINLKILYIKTAINALITISPNKPFVPYAKKKEYIS